MFWHLETTSRNKENGTTSTRTTRANRKRPTTIAQDETTRSLTPEPNHTTNNSRQSSSLTPIPGSNQENNTETSANPSATAANNDQASPPSERELELLRELEAAHGMFDFIYFHFPANPVPAATKAAQAQAQEAQARAAQAHNEHGNPTVPTVPKPEGKYNLQAAMGLQEDVGLYLAIRVSILLQIQSLSSSLKTAMTQTGIRDIIREARIDCAIVWHKQPKDRLARAYAVVSSTLSTRSLFCGAKLKLIRYRRVNATLTCDNSTTTGRLKTTSSPR